MIDIEHIRRLQIQMHGLSGADLHYTFYHDETNNIKKLRLKGGKFNVTNPSVFVLGGHCLFRSATHNRHSSAS